MCCLPWETQTRLTLLQELSEMTSVKFAARKTGSCLRSHHRSLAPADPVPQPLSPFSQLMPFQKQAHAINGMARSTVNHTQHSQFYVALKVLESTSTSADTRRTIYKMRVGSLADFCRQRRHRPKAEQGEACKD